MRQGEALTNFADAAQVLGVPADCGPEALRAAFRAAVKAAHPDRPGGDAGRLRRVIEAHDILRARPKAPASAPPAILTITPAEALAGLRRTARAPDGHPRRMRLPAGLRAGDRVRLGDEVLTIAIASQDGVSVIGDHLCASVEVDAALLRQGGIITAPTPLGPCELRVSRQDAIRGLARLAGAGLPARGDRSRGDLLIWLRPKAAPPSFETSAQIKRRLFAEAWAA